MAAFEDKIVQRAVADVLNADYEEDFLGFSYGFRPGRGGHDALDALSAAIYARKVTSIVDADIAKFFDLGEQRTTRLVPRTSHRRQCVLRLIQKWLRAGVLEDGRIEVPERGTGHGAAISLLLANVYLHYVLDLWAERGDGAKPRATWSSYATPTTRSSASCRRDARRFLDAMRERLAAFALTLHPDKTRLIEFGRFAAANRERRGLECRRPSRSWASSSSAANREKSSSS